MKTPCRYFVGFSLGILMFSSCPPALKADVLTYSVFKTAYYHQTNSSQPVSVDAPHAYDFAANMTTSSMDDILTGATVTTPGDNSQVISLAPTTGAIFFSASVGYFDTKTNLDTTFPDDIYVFTINDGDDSASLAIPTDEIYPAAVPYFDAATWAGLQDVDPAGPLTLTWNSFDADPSATEGVVFVRIFDEATFDTPFSVFGASIVTSATVPANALKFGTTYRVEVIFDNRIEIPDAGFGIGVATAEVGFDNRTYAALTTILPRLGIVPAGTNVVLSWSFAASDFQLESTPSLPTNTWTTITDPPTVIGNFNVLTNPASGSARFFRLHR
jgi:hypothetical protein